MPKVTVPYVDFPEEFRRNKESILSAVTAVLEKGDFILGDAVTQFEKEFAAICNVKHAISVANGTDAIILVLKALNIGAGDEVITASNSWISSASAIALVGATPVFADVESDQNISPTAIEKAITQRTKAILPVHLTGRCARMNEILAIAKKHGIPVIEDAAQAVTAEVNGVKAGAMGIAGCFSLHPLKNLNAVGDAGIITTNDDELAHKLRLLRHHGLKNREEVEFWGYNSRLDTVQAAVLRSRLPNLKGYLQKRRENARFYDEALRGCVRIPQDSSERPHTYHVYVIQTEHRDELKAFLQERGIETKVHYPIPIHQQKAAAYLKVPVGSLPVTEKQAREILSLPIHPYLSAQQLQYVADAIREFVNGKNLGRLGGREVQQTAPAHLS